LLHEAVGHGLEGDFNRKGTSAFSGRLGERVAAAGVTVVDDGSDRESRRRPSRFDSASTTRARRRARPMLIEDGILKGYMQDRLNARLMGVEPTGNGRRESFAHAPMPRMTNTFMRGGATTIPPSCCRRVKDGILRQKRSAAGRWTLCQRQVRLQPAPRPTRSRAAGSSRFDQGCDADRRRPERADARSRVSATTSRSTRASGSAARADRVCLRVSASRRC
jgi:hypothetical protein